MTREYLESKGLTNDFEGVCGREERENIMTVEELKKLGFNLDYATTNEYGTYDVREELEDGTLVTVEFDDEYVKHVYYTN